MWLICQKNLSDTRKGGKNDKNKKAHKQKQKSKRGKKRMLRKIAIHTWQDKVSKRQLDPESKKMIVVDELQENDTLRLLNFLVNGIDPKNLPKGKIDEIRFWNRFEKAMKNAGMDAQNTNPETNTELKDFIYLDNEAWKIITEKGFKDLDPRIGRNQETFEALEAIIEAEEFDPNAEIDKNNSEEGFSITNEGKEHIKKNLRETDPNAQEGGVTN